MDRAAIMRPENQRVIINVSDIMKSGLDAQAQAQFDSALSNVESENQDVQNATEGLSAHQFAAMYGMTVGEGEGIRELIRRHFEHKQQVLHPTMGTKRLSSGLDDDDDTRGGDEEEPDDRDRQERARFHRAREPVHHQPETGDADPEEAEDSNAGVPVSRVCIITDAEDDEVVGRRRRRKKRKTAGQSRMTIVDITNGEDEEQEQEQDNEDNEDE
jgi:hypothetical protein